MTVISVLKRLKILVLLFCGTSLTVSAADGIDPQRAYEAVQAGIQDFNSGDLDSASEKFAEAITLSSDKFVIRFDQACVHLADGQPDDAREKLREAVAGVDPQVVQSAHYNLGFLKVQQVKSRLQPDPAAIAPKDRTEIVDQLEQAVRHFRSTLEINPDHVEAAYNLELIRMYLKQLQTLWRQKDEQQKEPEESLTQLLLRLQDSTEDAQWQMVSLERKQGSASRQSAVSELQSRVRDLEADGKKVRPLVDQWWQSAMTAGQPQNPGQPPLQLTPEQAAAKDALTSLVNQLEAATSTTVSAIATEDWKAGQLAADESLTVLHELFLNIASYQETLQAALQKQQKLNTKKPAVTQDLATAEFQKRSSARRQQFVSDLSRAIQLQAEQQQPQVQQQLTQLNQSSREQQGPGGAPLPKSPASQPPLPAASDSPAAMQAEEQKAILEGLNESMKRAMGLSPDAILYADKAADLMLKAVDTQDGANPTEASENLLQQQSAQKKVLLLLQDIAEPLKNPDSDQQQQQQSGDQNQDQDQQNSDNSEPQENDQNSDSQDSRSDSQDPSEQQQKPEQSDDTDSASSDSKEQQEANQSEPLPDMRQREAEAVLRKAVEREQEYRELLKELQNRLGRKRVTKDW